MALVTVTPPVYEWSSALVTVALVTSAVAATAGANPSG